MNKELSLVLSPWSDTIVIDEIKFWRNDSVLSEVIGNDCYCDDVCPKVFMAGELTWVFSDATEITPFYLTTISGNPHLVYFIVESNGSLNGESFNLMMARAEEDPMEDMLFTGGDFNNQGFLAWKRIP